MSFRERFLQGICDVARSLCEYHAPSPPSLFYGSDRLFTPNTIYQPRASYAELIQSVQQFELPQVKSVKPWSEVYLLNDYRNKAVMQKTISEVLDGTYLTRVKQYKGKPHIKTTFGKQRLMDQAHQK
jgi:hypothetical protein